MTPVDKKHSPLYRQLQAYEESWKHHHAEAMVCREWEDAIAVGINIFHVLQEREQAWRDQVFRGTVPFSAEDDLDHRVRFANWLDTTREVLARSLPELEKRFGVVEGSEELSRCAERAEQIVHNWQPPALSSAVGLREMTLTPEAAADLDKVLEEAKQRPQGPSRPRMQEMATSELRRRRPE